MEGCWDFGERPSGGDDADHGPDVGRDVRVVRIPIGRPLRALAPNRSDEALALAVAYSADRTLRGSRPSIRTPAVLGLRKEVSRAGSPMHVLLHLAIDAEAIPHWRSPDPHAPLEVLHTFGCERRYVVPRGFHTPDEFMADAQAISARIGPATTPAVPPPLFPPVPPEIRTMQGLATVATILSFAIATQMLGFERSHPLGILLGLMLLQNGLPHMRNRLFLSPVVQIAITLATSFGVALGHEAIARTGIVLSLLQMIYKGLFVLRTTGSTTETTSPAVVESTQHPARPPYVAIERMSAILSEPSGTPSDSIGLALRTCAVVHSLPRSSEVDEARRIVDCLDTVLKMYEDSVPFANPRERDALTKGLADSVLAAGSVAEAARAATIGRAGDSIDTKRRYIASKTSGDLS